MLKEVKVKKGIRYSDYESYVTLALAVQELKKEAKVITPSLEPVTIWLINSTEKGGGVAEMLPNMISLLRQLNISVRWLVIKPGEKKFFDFTKKIHNMIHGEGEPVISDNEKKLYEKVSMECAEDLASKVTKGDIVVLHDPQPFGMGEYLKKKIPVKLIWRCHIGYDKHVPATQAAWKFLKNYADAFDHAVFTAPEYIPDYFTGISTVIFPSIDPLSHKNRDLHLHKLLGILSNGNILKLSENALTPDFKEPVYQLNPDDSFTVPSKENKPYLLTNPVITQVSRWDHLKGFMPLLRAFPALKKRAENFPAESRERKRLELTKLVLAGPDPQAVQDDPLGKVVLQDISDYYKKLAPGIRKDVIILKLPMESVKCNALIVNALQRCASVVVQNSVREGFGLTATEAMWKKIPVLVSNVSGLRQQVRDKIDGRVNSDPEDHEQLAQILEEMLQEPKEREVLAYNGQKKVFENFLVFSQIRKWLEVYEQVVKE